MRIKILSQVHLGGGKHGRPGQIVEVPDEIAENIIQVERAEAAPKGAELRDPDPEPENRDLKPKKDRGAKDQPE